MKNRLLPVSLALFFLMIASLACGMFTAPDSTAPEPVAPLPESVATLAQIPPTAAPMVDTQPASAADALPTLVPALDVNGDGQIDICEVIPQAVLEGTLGRTLTEPGQPFTDPALGDGCAFDFGKDNSANYFAYVTTASEQQFNNALANAVNAEPVTTIGDSAFLNDGADARQLWVRVGDKAVLVAIGDQENVPAEMIFARYLVDFAAKKANP